jgi:Xaa-Pro aminopeptidase
MGLVGEGAMASGFVAALRLIAGSRATFHDATGMVDALKAVKSAEEIALIERTAALQDRAFARVLDVIRPGLRDIDVAAAAWHEAQIAGSEQGIILCGSAQPDQASLFLGRHFQGRILEKGDVFSILIEVNGAGGFYTELARTVVLGRAPQALRDGFEVMRDAQDLTLAMIKPGADGRAIAAEHDAFLARNGLPLERRLYAHGQGYDMVERPLIRADETLPLAAGMCLAVHPGYETDRQFSVICDNYMVTADGVGPCLHRTEKRIFELG